MAEWEAYFLKNLPNELINFIKNPIVFEQMELPWNYPAIDHFEDFQVGYRVCEGIDENITGRNDGAWHPEGYVICSNYFNDPFVIHLDEDKKGYPVYYAQHGVGCWDFKQVASSLKDFQLDLIQIQRLEHDKQALIDYVGSNKNFKLDFWKELHLSLIESLSDENINANDEIESQPWIYGKLILVESGKNKIKVVSFLKQHFKVTGMEALQIINQLPLEIESGAEQFCQYNKDYLENIGAHVKFISD